MSVSSAGVKSRYRFAARRSLISWQRELDPDLEWDGPISEFGLSSGQIADANVTGPEVVKDAEIALRVTTSERLPD
ncbi:MAG: hypothetical protein WBE48_02610 [Xanthobacteraceae bacterium]|jgi:hypothetical protein